MKAIKLPPFDQPYSTTSGPIKGTLGLAVLCYIFPRRQLLFTVSESNHHRGPQLQRRSPSTPADSTTSSSSIRVEMRPPKPPLHPRPLAVSSSAQTHLCSKAPVTLPLHMPLGSATPPTNRPLFTSAFRPRAYDSD
jgi:hypothetical protein